MPCCGGKGVRPTETQKKIQQTKLRNDTMLEVFHWEPWVEPHLPTKEGRTAIDIGACEGIFTRWMAARYQKVYAIEPSKQFTYEVPPNVTYIPKAAWITSHPLVLNQRTDLRWTSVKDRDTHRGREIETAYVVDGIALDDLGLTDVDFIKVDCEGAEVQALCGLTLTIEASHPQLLIESHEEENTAWITTWLDRIGYDTTITHGPGYTPGSADWNKHLWLSAKFYK